MVIVDKKVEDDVVDTSDKNYSYITTEETDKVEQFPFYTSTPQKTLLCEECLDNSACVDCFVKHMLGKHEVARLMFSPGIGRSRPLYGGQTPSYKCADHNNSSYTLL